MRARIKPGWDKPLQVSVDHFTKCRDLDLCQAHCQYSTVSSSSEKPCRFHSVLLVLELGLYISTNTPVFLSARPIQHPIHYPNLHPVVSPYHEPPGALLQRQCNTIHERQMRSTCAPISAHERARRPPEFTQSHRSKTKESSKPQGSR